MESTEDKFVLIDLLDSLSKIEKSIITLRYLIGFSDKEIALVNNISRQAVKQSKNRALKKLKKSIKYNVFKFNLYILD